MGTLPYRSCPREASACGLTGTTCRFLLTRNELLCGVNHADKFILAIALVDPDDDDAVDGPHYSRNPFDREPPWGVVSINYIASDLIARAEP